MSGGSYDYLHQAEITPDESSELRRMAKRLDGLDWASVPARATRRILELFDEIDRIAGDPWDSGTWSLRDVWRAVEWWDSCDWSEEQVRETVEKCYPRDDEPAPPWPVPQPATRQPGVCEAAFEISGALLCKPEVAAQWQLQMRSWQGLWYARDLNIRTWEPLNRDCRCYWISGDDEAIRDLMSRVAAFARYARQG